MLMVLWRRSLPSTTSRRCCAVLCCAVLCCAVLCCVVLCCVVLCCAVLCCVVVFFFLTLCQMTVHLHEAILVSISNDAISLTGSILRIAVTNVLSEPIPYSFALTVRNVNTSASSVTGQVSVNSI